MILLSSTKRSIITVGFGHFTDMRTRAPGWFLKISDVWNCQWMIGMKYVQKLARLHLTPKLPLIKDEVTDSAFEEIYYLMLGMLIDESHEAFAGPKLTSRINKKSKRYNFSKIWIKLTRSFLEVEEKDQNGENFSTSANFRAKRFHGKYSSRAFQNCRWDKEEIKERYIGRRIP